MKLKNFNDLQTVKLQQQLKPAASRIYEKIFPNSHIEDLREDGFKVHILDKEFGIDALLKFDHGQWISIQEKYRNNNALRYGDFTQEYMNGNDTEGEWFKLGAQLYFYGWGNLDNTDFEKWFIMDIAKYKLIIEKLGGIEKVGRLQKNYIHGSATFYSIPIKVIQSAFITDYRFMKADNETKRPTVL